MPPSRSLTGRAVAVSVSTSPDLERLGLTERHVQLALAEMARAVFTSGGTLIYGGHLDPAGYTPLLVEEFERWQAGGPERIDGARQVGARLHLCLAWTVHRTTRLSRIREVQKLLGVHGEVITLDMGGQPVAADHERSEEPPQQSFTEKEKAESLHAMRRWMTEHGDARVVLGGARWKPEGRVPGIVEEALMALQAEQPVYLAGGFGGAAHDVVQALGVGHESWHEGPLEVPASDRDGLEQALAALRSMGEAPGWAGLRNGLTDEENRRLATSPRASEIATLVSRGLGRALPMHEAPEK